MGKQKFSKTWRRFRTLTIALILLCSCTLTALVVYAASTASFKMGGDVTFTVSGVNATITPGTQTGLSFTEPDTLVFSTAGSSSNSGDTDTWQDLSITMSDSTATFTFNVANTATSGSLTVKVTVNSGTATNMTVASSVDDETGATISAGANLDITITFTATNSEYNASITGFSIQVDLSSTSTTTNVTDSTQTATGYTLTISDSDGYFTDLYISINGETAQSVSALLTDGTATISNVTTIELSGTSSSTYIILYYDDSLSNTHTLSIGTEYTLTMASSLYGTNTIVPSVAG